MKRFPPETGVDSATASAPRSILIVDDNSDLADGLGFIFEEEGLETTVAYSAEQALEEIEKTPEFDCVVLDFRLPGLSGFAARRALTEKLPGARCVTMSGWSVELLLTTSLGESRVRTLRQPVTAAGLEAVRRALPRGGVVLVEGSGEGTAKRLANCLDELGIERVTARDAAAARSALAGAAPAVVFDFGRPVMEMLDAFFALREARPEILDERLVIVHVRPIAPDSAGDELLSSPATTGLLVKPMFDFDDVLRLARGG